MNAGIATVSNSLFSRNRALNAGGAFGNDATTTSSGAATFANTTMYDNRAGGGGGIANYGSINLTNCPLAHNLGNAGRPWKIRQSNAIYVYGNALTQLTNTVVSGHRCPGDTNCRGAFGWMVTSGGHNLSDDNTCFAPGGTDLLNSQAELASLASNGGPTQTMALCTGVGVPDSSCTGASPAIDAGDDSVTGPPYNLSTDQRGLPRLSGAHVDIGAYEVQQ